MNRTVNDIPLFGAAHGTEQQVLGLARFLPIYPSQNGHSYFPWRQLDTEEATWETIWHVWDTTTEQWNEIHNFNVPLDVRDAYYAWGKESES